jgi:hypothetical protein
MYTGHTGQIEWWSAFIFADYTILCYLGYLVLLFLADILFDLGSKLAHRIRLEAHSAEFIFLIGMASHIAYFVIGLSYYYFTGRDEFFAGFGIVDFADARYTIFRMKVVSFVGITLLSGLLLMPIVCGFLSYRKHRGIWKWCAFGFFFGYLALAKLLTLKPVQDKLARVDCNTTCSFQCRVREQRPT